MSERAALLLDDNLMTLARVRSQLEKVGYRVQTARRLPENGQAFALIIINLGSRGLPGIELIKSSLELFPTARVLGFCGHAEVEIRQQAKQAGLSRILTNDEALQDLANALGDMPRDDV
jgi:DNA-binding NarL/FixJ family response regulator